jgi:hypothetical protein
MTLHGRAVGPALLPGSQVWRSTPSDAWERAPFDDVE